MSFGWNEENIEKAIKLWKQGLSASQVAKQLSAHGTAPTRNAVIGKLTRLGITARGLPSRPTKSVTPPRQTRPARSGTIAPRSSNAPKPLPPPVELNLAPTATMLTLGRHACRWPIGDPAADDFGYCGRSVATGSYCLDHARLGVSSRPDSKRGANELIRGLRRYL